MYSELFNIPERLIKFPMFNKKNRDTCILILSISYPPSILLELFSYQHHMTVDAYILSNIPTFTSIIVKHFLFYNSTYLSLNEKNVFYFFSFFFHFSETR